jgi:hypothetical protein
MTIITKEEGWVFAIFSPSKESAEKSASPRMKFNPLITFRLEQQLLIPVKRGSKEL